MYSPKTTKRHSIALRLLRCGSIEATIRARGGEAAGALRRRFTRDGRGRAADYRAIFADLIGRLETARSAMLATNLNHLVRLARVVSLQEQRDEEKQRLRGRLVKIRRGLTSFYGAREAFALLGARGETPRDPRGLVQRTREAVALLDRPEAGLPPLDLAGIAIDRAQIAAQLRADADALERTLAKLERAQKMARDSRRKKNEALEQLDVTCRWVARAVTSMLQLAESYSGEESADHGADAQGCLKTRHPMQPARRFSDCASPRVAPEYSNLSKEVRAPPSTRAA